MPGGLSPRRILEIGVGEGHVDRVCASGSPAFRGRRSTCPTRRSRTDWRDRGLPCMFGDATTLPFPDDSFDLVLAIEVLEHVPYPAAALRELARVAVATSSRRCRSSRSGAPATWRAGQYWRDLGNTPGHVNHWTRWGFVRLVGTHLDVVDVHSPTPWTMVAARVRA